jgi:hypothetical protein
MGISSLSIHECTIQTDLESKEIERIVVLGVIVMFVVVH